MTKTCCPLARFDKKNRHFVCNDPDRCMGCGEPNNSWVSGAFRCKCEAPRMPRSMMDDARDDKPVPQVRYGN